MLLIYCGSIVIIILGCGRTPSLSEDIKRNQKCNRLEISRESRLIEISTFEYPYEQPKSFIIGKEIGLVVHKEAIGLSPGVFYQKYNFNGTRKNSYKLTSDDTFFILYYSYAYHSRSPSIFLSSHNNIYIQWLNEMGEPDGKVEFFEDGHQARVLNIDGNLVVAWKKRISTQNCNSGVECFPRPETIFLSQTSRNMSKLSDVKILDTFCWEWCILGPRNSNIFLDKMKNGLIIWNRPETRYQTGYKAKKISNNLTENRLDKISEILFNVRDKNYFDILPMVHEIGNRFGVLWKYMQYVPNKRPTIEYGTKFTLVETNGYNIEKEISLKENSGIDLEVFKNHFLILQRTKKSISLKLFDSIGNLKDSVEINIPSDKSLDYSNITSANVLYSGDRVFVIWGSKKKTDATCDIWLTEMKCLNK